MKPKTKKSVPIAPFAVMVLLAVAMLVAATGAALAVAPLEPTTTWNVTPVEKAFPGDRACPAGSTGLYDAFQSVTENPEGTYSDSLVIDGINVTVEITTKADNSFDFNIINGVTRQMFVKGSNYLLYQYDPVVSGATNTGPVSYDTGLHDGVRQTDGDEPPNEYQDVSHLDFCLTPVYPLKAEKTATATYDETWTWTLAKSVDPDQSEFAGNPLKDWTWKVTVGESSVEGNFSVTGDITVFNQNAFAVPVTIADVLDDGAVATVTCPTSQDNTATVPANGSVKCSYSATPADATATLNTATVTSGNPVVEGATAERGFTFQKNVVNGTATVTDDEIGLNESLTAGDGGTREWTATEGATCSSNPADYADDGKYSVPDDNTAKLTSSGGQNLEADAETTYTCYGPVVTKDAAASYDETWTWTLAKSVDPDQSEFAGNALNDWTWKVTVGESFVEGNYVVGGTIYVNNPAGSPGDMTVSLADQLNDGTVATVDCGSGETSVTVAPGQQGTCSYTASPGGKTATKNTANGTFNGIGGFVGTYDFTFQKNVVNGTATVTDDEIGLNESLTAGDGGTREWIATEGATCSSNPADYADDGKYSVPDDNTAKLTSSGGQNLEADAETTYTCYGPVVTKDAAASYDETWTWTLAKSVDQTSQSGYPGDFLDWVWKVTVGESFVEEKFAVGGTIYVNNPAGSPGDMTVSLVDQLNDGTIATVDCGNGATEVTVAPGGQGTCSYTASPVGKTATKNTANGTFNGISGFVGTYDFTFQKNVVNGTATVDDDQESDFPVNLVAGDGGTREWTETQDHTCSTAWADYGADGTYSATRTNKATLTSNGGQNLEANAATTYICEAGTLDLLKWTNGVVNPEKSWTFNLYLGPDGFGTTPIATDNTSDDGDGILDFDGPALRPDQTYTLCELGIPAGFSSRLEWELVNGQVVPLVPYNPNADDDPPEDVGNRCVDFGAGTSIPVVVGTTIHFKVDNAFPGGAPRTPGYWKNWNRCTNGGQQFTADANGGYAEGFWLLEDVLDPTIGGGIVWDDILDDDEFEYPITACEVAVDLLDKREVGVPEIVGDGKKQASNAFFNLATHLLAAQLNFGAGACTTQEVLDAALAAETLLDKVDFNGVAGKNLPKKGNDATLANELATYLDQYNNGAFCGNGND